MSIRNIKLRLNLEREEDRRAWEFIKSQEESYTKTVVTAICRYMDQSYEKEGSDAYWEKFTSILREELDHRNPLSGVMALLQAASAQNPSLVPAVDEKNTQEVEDKLFDFLDSF